MTEEKLNKIKSKIDELKVIDYTEWNLRSESNFIKLKKGKYKLNNNHTIERESVVKNIGTSNASAVFALTKDQKVIIVIEPRTALPTKDKVSIELPAGYIDDSEDGITAAKRELEEETGYTSKEFILLDSYYPSLGASNERIDLVLALNCIKTKNQHLDPDEYVNFEEVTLEEFKYLLDNNYIKDANSRIGYYKTLEYLKK